MSDATRLLEIQSPSLIVQNPSCSPPRATSRPCNTWLEYKKRLSRQKKHEDWKVPIEKTARPREARKGKRGCLLKRGHSTRVEKSVASSHEV
jgi:hypothetical protein